MKVTTYVSKRDKTLYIVVPQSTDPKTLPANVVQTFGGFSRKGDFRLDPAQPRIALDVKVAIKDIVAQGFHAGQVDLGRSGGSPRGRAGFTAGLLTSPAPQRRPSRGERLHPSRAHT
jgi:uncharacterized protein YcgL (UPF0745 family)